MPSANAISGTFSIRTALGLIRSAKSRNARHNSSRVSTASRIPRSTRCRIFDLPARENGWHGGPAAIRSTSRPLNNPAISLRDSSIARSRRRARPDKLWAWLSTAHSSKSTDRATRYPAASNPWLRPPAPQNKSIAIGRVESRTHSCHSSSTGASGCLARRNGLVRRRVTPYRLLIEWPPFSIVPPSPGTLAITSDLTLQSATPEMTNVRLHTREGL